MKNKIVGSVLFLIALVVLFSLFLGAVASGDSSLLKKGVEYTCTGEVEVDFLGIGKPELDPAPVCESRVCTQAFSVFSWLSPFSEEGVVHLKVDGKIKDSQKWDSALGGNPTYELKTGCVDEPNSLEVVLISDGIIENAVIK